MTNPLVSVVMPVYNAEKYLRQAIESILNQVFDNFEFIIINDGSTDSSVEIIKSYKDPRIILIENQINRGLVYSLNKGLDASRGDFIARMDADDISLPHRLQRQVNFLNDNPDIGVVGTAYLPIDEYKNPVLPPMFRPEYPAGAKWYLLLGSPLGHPTAMYRKALIQEAGGYHEGYSHAEDYELWTRMSQITKICSIKDICLLYRITDKYRVSNKYQSEQLQNSIRIRKIAYRQLFGGNMSDAIASWIQGYDEGLFDNTSYDACFLLSRAYETLLEKYPFNSSDEKKDLKITVETNLLTIVGKIKNPYIILKLFFRPFVFSRKAFIKTLMNINKGRVSRSLNLRQKMDSTHF
jgi:glycosyltransferase involved in cell wall biosynthesis